MKTKKIKSILLVILLSSIVSKPFPGLTELIVYEREAEGVTILFILEAWT
jgi:hypothetical protein